MTERKPQYVIELEKLYEEYPGELLAKALGVSLRQIQKYLQTVTPPKPKTETIGKIRESFAKHEKGQPIFEVKKEAENDLRDELLSAIRREKALIEKENARLQKDLDLSLGELRHRILLTQAICETNQEMLGEIQAQQNKKRSAEEILDNASIKNLEKYQRLKEEGKFAYVGK